MSAPAGPPPPFLPGGLGCALCCSDSTGAEEWLQECAGSHLAPLTTSRPLGDLHPQPHPGRTTSPCPRGPHCLGAPHSERPMGTWAGRCGWRCRGPIAGVGGGSPAAPCRLSGGWGDRESQRGKWSHPARPAAVSPELPGDSLRLPAEGAGARGRMDGVALPRTRQVSTRRASMRAPFTPPWKGHYRH